MTPTAADQVSNALRALGGRATLGDLLMATALARDEVADTLSRLMAEDRVEIAVSETAVMVYRLRAESASDPRQKGRWPIVRRLRPGMAQRARARAFELKTLQMIRARGGVISLAELVEHTGLPAEDARREAERLIERYGGQAHPSWDDHVVYAFPDLVESAHGTFHVREPRPAWARTLDPMEGRHGLRSLGSRLLLGAGAIAAGVLAWLVTFPPDAAGRVVILAVVAGASAGAAFALADLATRLLADSHWLRMRHPKTVRRYVLGYVFETALKGKGVVSLDRAVAYLRSRNAGKRVPRRTVETALRRLAAEFDAPITELNGDLFFGFRNVKRQFLASHVQRVRLGLERTASGRTIFDSGDSELAAAERELEEFDRAMREPRPDVED